MVRRTLAIWIGAALIASAAAVLVPVPAVASGRCDATELEATCDVLDDCYVIGAINATLPPNDAVDYYRTCLFTDHRYRLALSGTGAIAQPRRTPLPKIYQSTFWPLYCQALTRAGRRDRSICERRSANRGRHGQRRHTRRSVPRFTG